MIQPCVNRYILPFMPAATWLGGLVGVNITHSKPPYINNIERYLTFNSKSLSVIDNIGTEIRTLQPDRCVTFDATGGYIKVGTQFAYSSYAIGWRKDNNSYMIVFSDEHDYRKLFINGIEISDFSSSNLETNKLFDLTKAPFIDLFEAELLGIDDVTGDIYDIIIFNLDGAMDLVQYFNINAPLWHTDNMADSEFIAHRYYCTEGNDIIAFDSVGNNHGTYHYTDDLVPVSILHNTTIYNNIKNNLNRYGYGKAAYLGYNSKLQYPEKTTITSANKLKFRFIKTLNFTSYRTIARSEKTSPLRYSILAISGVKLIRIFVTKSDESGYLNTNLTFSSNVGYAGVYDYEFYVNGTSVFLTINGETKTYDFGVPIYFNFEYLGVPTAIEAAEGYFLDIKIGDVVYDALNGSTIGTPTNVDFNRIAIPNKSDGTDLFGRTALYSGIAKMNAEIVGGIVAKGNGTSAYIEVNIPIGDGDTLSFTTNSIVKAKVLFGLSSGYIVFPYDLQKARIYLANQATVLTSSFSTPISTEFTKYKLTINGNIIYLQRFDTGETISFTFPSDVNFTITQILGGTSYSSYSSNSLCCIEKNGTLFYGLNGHAINSLSGVAAKNNGVTFERVTDFTPQSTIDWLKYGGYILADGSKIPNPQFPLPEGATLVKPKGYNYPDGAAIDYDPTVWETYKEYVYETIENFDSGFEVQNVTNTAISYPSSEILRIECIFTNTDSFVQNTAKKYNVFPTARSGKSTRLKIRYKSNTNVVFGSKSGYGSSIVLTPLLASSSNIWKTDTIDITWYNLYIDDDDLLIALTNRTLGDYIEIDYIIFENIIEHIDYPNRGSNLYPYNPFTLSATAGVANGIDPIIDAATQTYSLVTIDNLAYQKITVHSTPSYARIFSNVVQPLVIGTKYIISFYLIKNTASVRLYLYDGAGVALDKYVTDEGFITYTFTANGTGNSSWFKIYIYNPIIGSYAGVADVKLYKLKSPNAIGHLPHLMFNKFCYVGNPFGLPEIYIATAEFLATIDIDNPYRHYEITERWILDNVTTEYHKYFYFYLKNGNMIDNVVYLPQRTETENTKLISKNYKPNYNG